MLLRIKNSELKLQAYNTAWSYINTELLLISADSQIHVDLQLKVPGLLLTLGTMAMNSLTMMGYEFTDMMEVRLLRCSVSIRDEIVLGYLTR